MEHRLYRHREAPTPNFPLNSPRIANKRRSEHDRIMNKWNGLSLRIWNKYAIIGCMKTGYKGSGNLGQLIVRHRKQRGFTLDQLAAKSGVAASSIYRVEQGLHASPRADTLSKIADALDIPLADVFAAAGYSTSRDLPSFGVYLHSRYRDLPPRARRELETHFTQLLRRYGPKNGEDEHVTPPRA